MESSEGFLTNGQLNKHELATQNSPPLFSGLGIKSPSSGKGPMGESVLQTHSSKHNVQLDSKKKLFLVQFHTSCYQTLYKFAFLFPYFNRQCWR